MPKKQNNISEDLKKEIFDKITKGEIDNLKALLVSNDVDVDFVDENDMSPLVHACYKGNKEIVQLILDRGVDVNECQHQHGYTALHFAALSGNADLCQLLLAYGAKKDKTNSVGRTPAQMAAFVGNHSCVATINNFIPKADINYYLKPQGLQKEPMLHPHLADSFHKFVTQINMNPVRVIINLQKLPGLLDNLTAVQKVLESMCKKEMSKSSDSNEIMSFKYHFLSSVAAEVIKALKRNEKGNEKKSEVIELLIKKFLKCKSDGTQEYQELFLRDLIREFPFRECAIFRQIVATLTSSDPPSAVSIVAAAINGQRAVDSNTQFCVTCSEEGASKKCSKCKSVQYCDRECQRLHWFLHKKNCNRTSQATSDVNSKVTKPDSEQISETVASRLQNLTVN